MRISSKISFRSTSCASNIISSLRLVLVAAIATLLMHGMSYAAGSTGRQALTTGVLKVCADPSNLPFSSRELEGFENKIIAVLAGEMGLEVRYTWFPQSIGFVRNTLRLRQCDLISGITTTSQLVQNTNAYYHSVYTMVYRKDSGITATTMSDNQLKDKKLGVVAGTPPANLVAQLGLLGNIRPYHLVADTRRSKPARRAVLDVDAGETDVAFIWGPIASYYAQEAENELVIVPLVNEGDSVQLAFRVSMAVRYNETDWKRKVNRVLKKIEPQIKDILIGYEVPLLDNRRNLITE